MLDEAKDRVEVDSLRHRPFAYNPGQDKALYNETISLTEVGVLYINYYSRELS